MLDGVWSAVKAGWECRVLGRVRLVQCGERVVDINDA